MARLAMLLVAIVVSVGAAVAGFLAASATAGGPGPVSCGDVSRCIPALPGEAVTGVLEERGFTCSDVACELTVGDTSYRASVSFTEATGGRISAYTVDVRYEPLLDPSPRAMGFLTWFAVLPFGDDPEADAVSREWVAENAGADKEATIRGFKYMLAAPEPGHVQLTMNASDLGNPFTEVPVAPPPDAG